MLMNDFGHQCLWIKMKVPTGVFFKPEKCLVLITTVRCFQIGGNLYRIETTDLQWDDFIGCLIDSLLFLWLLTTSQGYEMGTRWLTICSRHMEEIPIVPRAWAWVHSVCYSSVLKQTNTQSRVMAWKSLLENESTVLLSRCDPCGDGWLWSFAPCCSGCCVLVRTSSQFFLV